MPKLLLSLALLLALCTAALAQPAGQTAKDHEARGHAAFKAKQYDDAVAAWRAAYDLAKKPLLLFNIGLAQLRKPDRAAALQAFRDYLAVDGAGPGAEEARGYVATLTRDLAAEPRNAAEVRAQKGKAALGAGDAATAIAEYEAAHAIWPEPDYLFQIGQAHRLAGATAKALMSFARYLAVAPDGANAGAARSLSAELSSLLSDDERRSADSAEAEGTLSAAMRSAGQAVVLAEQAADSAEQVLKAVQDGAARRTSEVLQAADLAEHKAAIAAQDETLAREAATRLGAPTRADGVAADAARARSAAERGRRAADEALRLSERAGLLFGSAARPGSPKLRLAGYITMGVGVALIGGGIYFALQAKAASDDVSEATVWSAALDDQFETGQRDEKLMYGLYAVGGAAVIGGGLMYLFGRPGRARRTEVTPSASASGAGVLVRGSF